MATDIHWFLERRDTAGVWHCTLSKTYVFRLGDLAYPTMMGSLRSEPLDPACIGLDPAVATCGDILLALIGRSYPMFAVLSNIRSGEGLDTCLAHDGLPDDPCPITVHEVEADSDLHTRGWISLTDLPGTPPACDGDDPYMDDLVADGMQDVTRFRDGLLAAARVPSLADAPLFAPADAIRTALAEDAAQDGFSVSAHAKRQMMRVRETLLPAAPDTARVVIAYDN